MDDTKEAKKGKESTDGVEKPSTGASKGPPNPPMDPARFKELVDEMTRDLVAGLNKGAAKDHPPRQ